MRALAAGLFSAALVSLPLGASAQDLGGWTGKATLYGWLPVINGAQEGFDGEPLVDLNTNDVLSRLDMVAMGSFELRKDKLGLIFDAVYVDLSNDGTWLQDRVTVSTSTRIGMYTVAAAYRAWEDPKATFDVYAGGRFFDTALGFGVATDNRGRSKDINLDWSDPIVGVRGAYAIDEHWSLHGFADAGGFDGNDDLSWQAYVGGAYAFNDHWNALLGYRYLSVLYQTDTRAKLDIDVQGPVFGVTYSF